MKNTSVSRFWAIAILVSVPLAVLAWHGLALCARPAHLKEIVEELGSVREFSNNLAPNHSGTQLFFVENTEHGHGAYLGDTADGRRTLLFEEINLGAGYGANGERFLAWANDDSCFAYVRQNHGKELVIADGKTGATQGVVRIDLDIASAVWLGTSSLVVADNKQVLRIIKQFNGQWLHPLPFKYFRDSRNKAMKSPIQQLTARSPNAVVWRQDGKVWQCGVESDRPENILGRGTTATMDNGLDNTGFTLYELGYNASAPKTGLPVHGTVFASQSASNHLYAMAPDYTIPNVLLVDTNLSSASLKLKKPAVVNQLSILNSAGHGPMTMAYVIQHLDGTTDSGEFISPNWHFNTNAAFVAGGRYGDYPNGFDAVKTSFPRLFAVDVTVAHSNSPVTKIDFSCSPGPGHAAIFAVSGATNGHFTPLLVTGYNADVIQEAIPAEELAQAERNYLGAASSDDKKHPRFVVQSLYGQAPGIWEYTPGNSEPRCVIPNLEKRNRYTADAPIETGQVTNASGEKLTYYLLAPVHAAPNIKHPFVLAILGINEMGFAWSHNHEALANCGAYFVSVDRRGRDAIRWSEDALTVFRALSAQLPVDTNHVFLYADSAGTGAAYALLHDQPDLWRGAILFSPGGPPDPADIRGKRIFLDCGGADRNLPAHVTAFQDAAALQGSPITLLIHPGLGHVLRMPRLERERMREALILFGTK